MHFADRLVERARSVKSVVCVGIDPRWAMLPEELKGRAREAERDPARAVAWAYAELAEAVIEAVAPYAAAAKPQSAFFEAAGPAGSDALARTLELASDAGLVTIADAKRGDIGSTSEAYAQAFFGGLGVEGDTLDGLDADALTINPYLGTDGVAPFLEACDARGRGVFVLVRTSNPSAAEIQDLVVEGGAHERVFERVAALVKGWGEGRKGESGWSSVGAVAGATTPEALAEVRALLPESILLVPGYGAQGAGAADVVGAFNAKGEGAVVNASRSIVFAKRDASTLAELAAAASEAAKRMRDEIGEALAKRSS
ncbi:MAG: orotidine-5'-phosphate decarboxylase [Planctomycetota bacterium]|jgi:orotidine-5'-phosphate decarboxylase